MLDTDLNATERYKIEKHSFQIVYDLIRFA